MNATNEASEMAAEDVSMDKLMEDMSIVVVDMEELLKATTNQTGERIVAARIKASESLQLAKARLAVAHASVMGKAKMAVSTTDNYIHDNPWQSMGVAAALGLSLGVLISRL